MCVLCNRDLNGLCVCVLCNQDLNSLCVSCMTEALVVCECVLCNRDLNGKNNNQKLSVILAVTLFDWFSIKKPRKTESACVHACIYMCVCAWVQVYMCGSSIDSCVSDRLQ